MTPTPPEGFKIIPREWLEAGNPLPEDTVFWGERSKTWLVSPIRGERTWNTEAIHATAQPLPCFAVPSHDQGPQPEQRMAKEQPGTHDLGPICGPHKGDPLSRQMLEKVIVAVMEELSCDQGPEHNPDGLTPEQYGAPEWRLLRVGETVHPSDELRLCDGWEEAMSIGNKVGRPECTYRRRVAPEPEQSGEPRTGCPTCAGMNDLVATQDQRIAELERENSVLWEQLADRDKLVADYRAQLAASEKDREVRIFHDDIDAQEAAIDFLKSCARDVSGVEIRHGSFERSDGCFSTLWEQGQLQAVVARIRNDWNRTVLTTWRIAAIDAAMKEAK